MNTDPRTSRGLVLRTSLGTAILAGAGATALALAHPAAAQAALAAVTTVVCKTTGACVNGSNQSSGEGVLGASNTGYGVFGTSSSGVGTYGYSPSGIGAYGNGARVGLEGIAASGTGLIAEVESGEGAYVYANNGFGLVAFSSGDPAIFADNFNNSGNAGSEIGGEIIGQHIGLDAEAPASSWAFPLVARDTSGNDLFYVNGFGEVYAKGGYATFTAVSSGKVATAFGSQSTAPTIEDSGTAQLVAGAAAVRLDATFAAAIDPRATYRVFVTPNGDTRGLFVSAKTATGFTVREAQAGHSTVAFDYRIIGSALGKSTQRMAIATAANVPPPLTGAAVLPRAPAGAPVLARPSH